MVPYQDCPSPPMTPVLYQACGKSVHVITTDGQILRTGLASMFILEAIGYPTWLIRPLTWPPFIWFVNFGYGIVERNRMFVSRFLFTRE